MTASSHSASDSGADSISSLLARHGQSHLLAFEDRLSAAERRRLREQIEHVNFVELDRLIQELVLQPGTSALPPSLAPAAYYPAQHTDASRPWRAERFREAGEDMIRSGKVAAFTVAGGQGTRLGWNGPKGTFPATVVTGKPLFRVFAEQLLAASRRYGTTIPWYIMTSPANDADTRAFFVDNNHFGLAPADVFMFPQGVMPAIGLDGKILLETPGSIALSPDGHGGSFRALAGSGAIDDMAARGIEVISYFQVDNPLVRIVDPVFLGLHATAPDSSAEMSSKMVAKVGPEEKVGVFCVVDGRTAVVEYSDLPKALAEERQPDGRLRFLAGSIAIHAIGVEFVQRLTADPDRFGLPFHRAEKKVACIDPRTGEAMQPERPNAVKLETFVFDALPLARSSVVLETRRSEEFAPIKNAEGVDSPASSHELQSDRAGAWLEQAGVRVPRRADGHVDARLEISPLTALSPEELLDPERRSELPSAIRPGQELAI
ncbi:MAG: UDPGP type 1 family protein [Phycisphaerales bacterium]|nr:UDPGP type 1 family protein [Phycisphaerales bacterium]